jgi:uncharacterized protein
MCERSDLTDLAQAEVGMRWGVKIPLRDGTQLSATVYLPRNYTSSPVIVTLTPYTGQMHHDRGVYFAAHGYPFVIVDVRGRGNSEGAFRPVINEAKDGFDVVEWVAQQAYCNGQVAMWGGSYGGFVQWATAKEFPPHLATIVPVAAPYAGVDLPFRNNIPTPYLMQWLTLVSGRTLQDKIFWNNGRYWGAKFRLWAESGVAFKDLDSQLGVPSAIFQEWISHPEPDAYWDSHNPTSEQYAELAIPILTITGIYDGDQPGALMHYKQHLRNCTAAARMRHYLVIGPWDHAGTRSPTKEFCGLKVDDASLVDLPRLHREWYAWTMRDGPKPEFLRKNVAYYVMGAEKWRYSESIETVTGHSVAFYLQSNGNPTDVFKSGSLSSEGPQGNESDHYIYDPRDVSLAELESVVDPENRADHRMIYASVGKQLVYHSPPFEKEVEISGFFVFSAWISIDRADTDFRASVFEVGIDGRAMQLTTDSLRARYREDIRNAKLIRTKEPLRYDFEHFMFVSRLVGKGSRLRLVVGPINSIYSQKNYNSGGIVSEESMRDAQPVTVTLFHDVAHPSALYVPYGQPET